MKRAVLIIALLATTSALGQISPTPLMKALINTNTTIEGLRSAIGVTAGGGAGYSPSNQIPSTLVFESDGTNVFINAGLATHFNLVATNSFRLNAPTNAATDGQSVTIRVRQDATGSRVCTTIGSWKFGTDITEPITLSSGATKVDYIGCKYNLESNHWDVVSFVRGY